MERFVIIVKGFQPLTIITKRSILDVAAVLDPPLSMNAKPETQNTTFKGASKLHNDCISRFKMIRAENFDNIIVRTLNINSISPKFAEFKLMASGYFDVIILTETKLDDSFPKAQFCIDRFSIPYRLDRNRNGGGLIIYVRDIPSKMLTKHNLPEDIEAAFIELLLLCATYRAPSQNHNYFFDNIDKGLDVYSTYERVAVAGDFNAQVGENTFDTFLYQHKLTSINRYPTCYKNPNNSSCIDHILTNSPKSFLKQKLFLQGYQTSIKSFYLYLSYIFQRRRLRTYYTGILEILKRIILIGIFRIDFQQNL